jgi:metallo-beta-lactamase class B
MRLAGIVAAAFLMLPAPALGQWVEFASPRDGFSANFPGQPRITETTFRSQFGADLPARVYSAELGPGRYSLTVVDYRPLEGILTAKSKNCPAAAETCRGNTAATSTTGAGYWKADRAGALLYASWLFLQRDAKVTHYLWNNVDFVEGHHLQLTNTADGSRTLAAIYMHEDRLYILEGTVPDGHPEPGLFQQSIQWIDEQGRGFRYQSLYHNGFPAPPRRVAAEQAAPPPPQEALSQSYRASRRNDVEYQKVPPLKVFDDLYYVGPGFVSVWLIPTSAGLILIDTAQEPYVDHVVENIRKAGFNPADIRYIVVNHGHLDHFGGAARIQKLSGARVAMLDEDWTLMEQAARPTAERPSALPIPARDLVLTDGGTLKLGGTTLKVYKHPGHTAGSLSIEFTVHDAGRPHKAFMFGGAGPRGGVESAHQFVESVRRASLVDGVEVSVPGHAWNNDFPYPNGGIFERAQRLALRKPGEPHPFADGASWKLWMTQLQAGAAKYLADQLARKP